MELEHDNDENINRNYAPIVLFVYNRPEHTFQTVEALKNNFFAKESELYIYSDAPKSDSAFEKVEEVRAYISNIQGFKSVNIIERDKNFGLAKNIISGVTEIVNKYGKVIVLEDDLLTSRYFLQYMNDALDFYENSERVAQISGYIYPMNTEQLPETFFLALGESWGWATWKRAWDLFERNPDKVFNSFDKKEIYRFNFDNTHNFWQQVVDNHNGNLFTWAIFFYAAIFKQKKLVLYPKYSLIQNIGFDSSGVHCGATNAFTCILSNSKITDFSKDIEENALAYERLKKFFCSMQSKTPGFLPRTINRLKNSIKKRLKRWGNGKCQIL